MEGFTGKVALVVGGSGGMGRSTAVAFGRAGARVVVAARRAEEGEAVVREIAGHGGEARFVRTDVDELADIERAVKATVEAFERLDYAVNVPGITGQVVPLVECSDDNWDRVILTNLTGMFRCMRAEIRQMLAQGTGGAIVNISSGMGRRPFTRMAAYCATKRALESLTETAALEYARQGIRVNAVAPGAIDTDTFQGFVGGDPAAIQAMAETHPMARVGLPDEVARAVLFLCAEGTFTTGATLAVDGGWVIRA